MKRQKQFGSCKALLLVLAFATGLLYFRCSSYLPVQMNPCLRSRNSYSPRFSSFGPSSNLSDAGHWAVVNYSRSNVYCNSPFSTITGTEGRGPDGFNLRMVFIFTRHGARAPLFGLPGFRPEKFDCNFRKWYTKYGNSQKFQRFPNCMSRSNINDWVPTAFESYSSHPDKNVCSNGSLTSLGALQHFNLGQFMYDRYITNEHLFDRKSSLTSQMHVRSTRLERTFQSALAFLYGFLPECDLSELEFTHSQSIFLCKPGEIACTCSITEEYRNRYRGFFERKGNYTTHVTMQIQSVLNETIEKVPDLRGIMDHSLASYCHGKNTPCSARLPYPCIEYSNLEQLWKDYIDIEKSALRHPARNALKYSYLAIYPILVELSNRIQKCIEGKSMRNFILYSGHDVTIRALLYAFGIYDGTWPPFASRFVFELYETSSHESKQQFYFRILYNGNDVTNDVFFCQDSDFKSMCDIERFKLSVSKSLHELFKTSDYAAVCKGKVGMF